MGSFFTLTLDTSYPTVTLDTPYRVENGNMAEFFIRANEPLSATHTATLTDAAGNPHPLTFWKIAEDTLYHASNLEGLSNGVATLSVVVEDTVGNKCPTVQKTLIVGSLAYAISVSLSFGERETALSYTERSTLLVHGVRGVVLSWLARIVKLFHTSREE